MSKNGKPKVQVAKILAGLRFSAPDDADGKKAFPNVFELLAPLWADGKLVRQAGRMSLKPDGGSWRVSIECPTECVQTTVIVKSLKTALEEAEGAIASGKAHFGPTWQSQKKNLPVVDDLVK